MKGSYLKVGQKISKNPQNWVLHKFSFTVYIQKWLYNVYIEYSNSYFLVKRTISHSRFRMSWCVLCITIHLPTQGKVRQQKKRPSKGSKRSSFISEKNFPVMGLKFFFSSFILHSTSKYLVRYRFSAVKITAKGYVSLDRLICFFAYFVLFCVQKKEGCWFLSTKFQIPLIFPRSSSRLDTFQFFRRKLPHQLRNLQINCIY